MNRHVVPQRPPLQQRVDSAPHRSGPGKHNGYSEEMRALVMAIRAIGASRSPLITHLRALWVFPSTRTENRWVNLVNQLGHYRKCRPTGNNRVTVLRDHDLILLSLYRLAYPKATAAEINAFLFRANFGNPMFWFYHPSQIFTAESRTRLTRKVGSTMAYQAMLLVNRQKRWCYWNLPCPYGIADIRRQDIIDLDECGIEFSTAERDIGEAYIGERVKHIELCSMPPTTLLTAQ